MFLNKCFENINYFDYLDSQLQSLFKSKNLKVKKYFFCNFTFVQDFKAIQKKLIHITYHKIYFTIY